MFMNQSTKKIGFGSTLVKLFAAAALIVGAVASQQAVAAIKNTKHNLSSSGTGSNHADGTGAKFTEEICVFCHTPHGSNTGVTAPLWNKANTNQTYTVYSSTTLDAGAPVIGSVSLACLSCHDGTQAMDNMVNAPGSGWDGAGSGTNAGVSQNYTWTGDKKLNGSYVANIGIDLSNDHPIGIEYCGGASGSGYTGGDTGTCNDKDFKDARSGGGGTYYYVDTNSNSTRDKKDMILYTRTGGKAYVECASCHDPHVESKGTAEAPQVAFLRVTQAGSGVCLSCHVK
jgi:hypothetical protein